MKNWPRLSIAVVVLMTMLVFLLPSAQAQEGTEVEFEGVVERLDLGTGVVVVSGTTCHLTAETVYLRGRGWRTRVTAQELAVGQRVEVAGIRQADGTVLVQHIRIKPAGRPGGGIAPDQHPVGVKISRSFGVPYEQVMALYEQGFGFGEIMQAYRLAAANAEAGVTAEGLLQLRQTGLGWGEICKQFGMHPGGGRPPWAGQGGRNPHKDR